MLEGPIGAASFNNEFGRPAICGYFRTFEQPAAGDAPERVRGYHKPIMIAGGLGNIRRSQVQKPEVPGRRQARGARRTCDAHRPRRRRGLLGGQRRSERGSGFRLRAARQPRDQRRAQEVIDHCWALGARNPILLIHDVGAGGLSNAVPEAVAHSARGARIDLRTVPSAEPGMSPLELWCNEAQERYVLAIAAAGAGGIQRHRGARTLPVSPSSARSTAAGSCGCTTRCSATRRWTCRSRCCSASRRA